MKFTLSFLALVAAASAQSVQIGSPTQGQVLTRGATISVRVQRPVSKSCQPVGATN